ncbi:MAG: protein phosphatase 2C domain-containing protein [Phormidesmis sp.]
MINCPNPNCNAVNPEGAAACQNCSSALPHYYLWGVGERVATLRPGELLNDRYLLKSDRIFLDTKPAFLPESPVDIPAAVLPYLHLSVYPLHVPRLYAVLDAGKSDAPTLLLESSALSMATVMGAEPKVPNLLPMLSKCWADAPPLRQLSWLWQIAQMWESFQNEQVAVTLLTGDLVRVDGSVIRLLALSDGPTLDRNAPTIVSLSVSWQPLAATAHSSIRSFLTELCDRLEQSQINAEQLCEQLGLAISVCAQEQDVTYDLAIYTDQGPTRKRNEDACFPKSGTSLTLASEKTKESPQLLIVCDGIGGHQGGDIASKLAIATIKAQLEPVVFDSSTELSPTEVMLAIERAICAANDEIAVQNDQAHRQARDRMGTTLVLALVRGAEVYIAHLGDSRAYRISAHNCQQVTLDDDVASRQVRLGGSLYREMLTQPGAGSLVQALGMGPSQMLRPTVQRFVIDQSCVFLLCSDGLSDSDRVEQFWASVLKPLVAKEQLAKEGTQKNPVDAIAQQLVSLANKYNGHDNVTVGLLAAQVLRISERMVPKMLASPVPQVVTAPGQTVVSPQPQSSQVGTQPLSSEASSADISSEPIRSNSQPSSQNNLQKIGLIVLLLALFGSLAYTIFPGLREKLLPNGTSQPTDQQQSVGNADTDADQPTLSPPKPPAAAVDFAVGDYMRIRQSDGVGIRSVPAGSGVAATNSPQLLLYPKPTLSADSSDGNAIPGTVPTGGIARVLNRQTAENQTALVQLKVCSIPSGESLSEVPTETDVPNAAANPSDSPLNQPESTETNQPLFLPPGSKGWTLSSNLVGLAEPITGLQSAQIGSCES